MNAHSPRIWVVVATYNERDNVVPLIDRLMALPQGVGVVIVDDRSPDGTAEQVREAAARYPGRVDLIERPGKMGYGPAFVEGFRRALALGAEAVVSMDADFSHDPSAVPELLERLAASDVVVGSRYIGGIRILNWNMRRLLLSKWANAYVNAILRLGVTDSTSGFRAYRASALAAIEPERATARGYAFLVELLERAHRLGLRIVEAPIVYTERRQGRSKMSRRVMVEAALRPWRLLVRRWLRRR